MPNLNKLTEKISQAGKVLLITHENPDGDALGSMLAVNNYLLSQKKIADMVCVSSIPKPFQFLINTKKIKRDFFLGDYDLVVILDCGDLRRTGYADRLKQLYRRYRKKIVNIDHHPKNNVHKISWYNYVNYNLSSTSELVYLLFRDLKFPINRLVATYLLCGLYTDTGGFKHSNTSPQVLKIAAELLRAGARLKDVTKNLFNGKSVSSLKLWGLVLSRIKRNRHLGLVTSIITKKDLNKLNATQEDLAGAVNLINSIPNSRAAILFSEPEDGKIKASIRTERNDIDVAKLANLFDGGGLKKAAGFTVSGQLVCDKNGEWEIKHA